MPAAVAVGAAYFATAVASGGGAAWTAAFIGAQLAAYGGLAYGANAAANALNKPSSSKAGSPNFGGDYITNTESTLYAIPIGYGRFKMGGNILRRHTFGESDRRIHMIVGLCAGEIESIADPELNDKSWDEMTTGVGFDEVHKYLGTLTQTPCTMFMTDSTASTRSVTGSWSGAVFTRSSGRSFKASDVNSYFIADDYYKIVSYDSANQITCDRNGSGTTGCVDRTKKFADVTGSWDEDRFTRTSGRKFKAADLDGWFETDDGEWQITEVDVDPDSADYQSIVCSGSGHSGTTGRVDEGGFSQAYRGLAYLALQLKATSKLNGQITVTSVVEGKKVTPLAGGAKAFSRNPAVIVYDFLTDVIGIPSGDIDVTTFQTVETYCDALVDGVARYMLDILIDSQKPIVDILQDMMSSFNGALIYSENKIKLLVEKAEASNAYAFTEDNIVENSFSFWRVPERVNQVKITFMDEDNSYRYETVIAKDTDDIALYGVIEKEISAAYITRKGQASRIAQFLLDKAMASEFQCQLTGSYGSSIVEPLDVVTVTHSVPGWTAKRFRVLDIQKAEDGTNTFTLESYNGSIYHDKGVAEQETRHDPAPSPDSELEHVTSLDTSEQWFVNNDGTLVPYVRVTFDTLDELLYWSYCNIYVSIDGGTTWRLDGRSETGVDYRVWGVKIGTTVTVKAVSVNWKGAEFDFDGAPTDSVTLSGKPSTSYPSNVSGGGYTFSGNTLKLYWSAVDITSETNKDFAGYEVRLANSNWGSIDGNLVYRGAATFVVLNNITSVPGPYYVKAYSTSRIYSQTALTITPANSAPATVSGLTATALINGVRFDWTASTDALHKDYYVGIKIASGGSFVYHYQAANFIEVFLPSTAASGETIYIEVKDHNTIGQSSASAATANTASQAIPATDFKASDLDVPLYKFDGANTFTGNSSGLKWDAFYIYYQGKKITVNAEASYQTDAYYYTPNIGPSGEGGVADGASITLLHTNTDSTFATAMKAKHQWPVFLYDADLDTAWLVPGNKMMFVGFLKVNNLSAISANLGTVTAGTITGVNGTFTNLNVEENAQIGPDLGDGVMNLTVDADGNSVLEARGIEGSHYMIYTFDGDDGIAIYGKSGSWPTKLAAERMVSFDEGILQLKNGGGIYIGGASGYDLMGFGIGGGYIGDYGGAKTITVSATGDCTVPAAALQDFAYGSYTGDDEASKTITHGMGRTPKLIIVFPSTNTGFCPQAWTTAGGSSQITSVGSTTFTVNGASGGNALNDNSDYHWIAL